MRVMPSLYEMTADVPFVAPVMVGAFDGWIDASAAATGRRALAENGEVVARFDADALYDYRARRPVLDVVDGTLTHLEWPELTRAKRGSGRAPPPVLTGPEPDYHWRQLGTDVLDLPARRRGPVGEPGAIPAAVPHTRPVPVLATASREGLLHEDEAQGPQGLLRVPAAALQPLELAVSGTGIPAVGFFAQVPHYVGGPFAAASIALLEHLGRHLGVELPLGSLLADAQEQRDRLDAAVAADEDAARYLSGWRRWRATTVTSGDELASEIERFLSDRGREGGDDAGAVRGTLTGRHLTASAAATARSLSGAVPGDGVELRPKLRGSPMGEIPLTIGTCSTKTIAARTGGLERQLQVPQVPRSSTGAAQTMMSSAAAASSRHVDAAASSITENGGTDTRSRSMSAATSSSVSVPCSTPPLTWTPRSASILNSAAPRPAPPTTSTRRSSAHRRSPVNRRRRSVRRTRG